MITCRRKEPPPSTHQFNNFWDIAARSTHCFKYRLFYGAAGLSRVRYDNERGKADHRHMGDEEFEYTFTTLDRLLDDFERDIENWS